ncbi:MAG TPA: hypothetical protein VK735_13265 [Pseudonocardia sp.]|jgi:hypothetical protein|uniref:hypothetical protein n=1 Tax=Pseudonocardia sp. TaxID=60912 RepID=UPI002C24BF30|nr:hypothetical protein [Pseudonocardia sp.]HTF48412.1 hypothetical protein [Pseudonocardia sp.]
MTVTSVAGRTGDVVLTAADVGSGTFTGMFGINKTPSARQPINLGSTVNGSAAGTEDKVAIELSPTATGDFTGSTGSNPGFFWGLNVFATTGPAAGDGKGIGNFVGSLFEASIRSTGVTLPYVAGAQVEAAFFGNTNAAVTQMESLRVCAPKRKDGATGGTATNVYCLFIESPDAYPVGATSKFALFVDGGVTRLQGRVDVKDTILSYQGDLTVRGNFTGNGRIRLNTDGIGFYGATPVARPTLPSAGSVTAAHVRTALISLGLCQ